ncbi:MAG: sugar ABC transporter permease [Chthoniobacterales bacterium]|nr:sugar ABC transporter permease [Chthoniobacterales bacterium]
MRGISKKRAWREWGLYLFVLPSLVAVGTFCYYPAGSAVYNSFFRWAGEESREFVGFENFANALEDSVFWGSFVTVGVLAAANVIKIIPSVVLAVLIHRVWSERWRYWYRVLVVLPMVVPTLVTLFLWKFFYDPNYGILNRILDATGVKSWLVRLDSFFGWGVFFGDVPIAWLGQPELVLPSLIFLGFPWIGAVGVMVFLAGLQRIDPSLYDAAELDGASGWQKFVLIELPLLLTQIRLMLVLLIVGTLQGYGLQLLLLGEEGGPAGRGMTPGLWMFNRAFVAGGFGYACALGLILFGVIVLIPWAFHRWMRIEK